MRTILQEIPQPSITKINLKMTYQNLKIWLKSPRGLWVKEEYRLWKSEVGNPSNLSESQVHKMTTTTHQCRWLRPTWFTRQRYKKQLGNSRASKNTNRTWAAFLEPGRTAMETRDLRTPRWREGNIYIYIWQCSYEDFGTRSRYLRHDKTRTPRQKYRNTYHCRM